jgi:hypothetical protein
MKRNIDFAVPASCGNGRVLLIALDKGIASLLQMVPHFRDLAGMRTFTAKDIAERIARSDDAVQPAFERIRHWTREGLLLPHGEENPGTGRKREYAESEVGKARLLNALANFGITIKTMKVILAVFNREHIMETAPPGFAYILTVEKSPAGKDVPRISLMVDEGADAIMVPLGRATNSVLFINLSSLMVV